MAKKDRGNISVFVILVGILVALVGGYFLYKQKGGNLPSPETPLAPRATEKDFEFIEDATLRKHFVAQANQSEYRFKTYSDAADLNFINEVEIKGENFNTRDQELTPDGTENKHKVEIGDTVYVKDFSDNKWWRQTIKPEEVTDEQKEEPLDFKEEYSKPDLKFKSLGKEPCGSPAGEMTCYKYEQTAGSGTALPVLRTFWFDDKKYLLRREESKSGEFKISIEYSYDGINITAPSPTKEVPEGKSIYDYYFQLSSPTAPNYEIPQPAGY